MGLSDLKKKRDKTPIEPLTVDEFIDDAELYALGQPRLVSPERRQHHPILPEQPIDSEVGRPVYKKATYSMSLDSIDQLADIAIRDGMKKSQLLRLFTHYFYHLPPEERDLIYDRLQRLFGEHLK
ncbi:CopG family transcriptional regulator [Pseudaeromonas paramecii]|uniref:CopG family transcriptional regulator n=1 Tax=Pseudaeromonas paramecii TaxID=2138166 RepID=A0ABP8QCD7_9GAMM